MKKTLIIGLMIFGNSVFGQIPGKTIEGPIVLFDTLTVKKGDIIYLGKGSDPENGDFKYIYSPKDKLVNTLYTIFSNNDDSNYKLIPQRNLNKEFAGKQLVVGEFSEVSSGKRGQKYFAVINNTAPAQNIGGIYLTYVVVEFEPAINSGEIIKIIAPVLTEKAPALELLFSPFEITVKALSRLFSP